MFKRLRYEYWPWYLFFLPALPVCILWMIRTRKFFYFTATNPAIPLGGFFGEKKMEILNCIPEKYKSKSQLLKPGEIPDYHQWKFPLILKPNVGERGNGVIKVSDISQLSLELSKINEDFILQEFCEDPYEYGVFYSRIPGSNDALISSITLKKFMEVEGDGKRTIEELMSANIRFQKQIKRLKKENPELLKVVLENGRRVCLEPRGNHCLGTEFVNANYLIHQDVIRVFDEIVAQYEGFNYGRFDLKAKSPESLRTGVGLTIFELNGVSSEPGHIYDSNYNLFKAYKDIARHWWRMGKIAQVNLKNGFKVSGINEFVQLAVKHFWK